MEKKYDLIVCGGGPSGVSAAIAAGRRGVRTLLVERYGFCGGMATAALVNPWSGHEYTDPITKKNGSLIGGIFRDVVLGLNEYGGFGSVLSPAAFDEEALKVVYDELLEEAGVHVQYHTYLTGVQMAGNVIQALEVISKSGKDILYADSFIDCSGDADLAAMAGVGFNVGRPSDGLTQAMTVSFRMANVDKVEMQRTGHIRRARHLVEPYFQEALKEGSLHYPYRPFIHFYDYPRPGVLHFNMTRINKVSGLSVKDLTFSETEGRRQAYVIGQWLIKNVPYFSKAYIEKVACQVGVRETRHIEGVYTINSEDILAARKFEDGIVRSRYFIDIHNPTGAKDVQQKEGTHGALDHNYGPAEGDFYEVPFRSLISEEVPNLLVACRALSATHEASAAIRVMATMHGIGEAAGVAASAAVSEQIFITKVSGVWVRKQIAYLNEEPDFEELWAAENGFPWSLS